MFRNILKQIIHKWGSGGVPFNFMMLVDPKKYLLLLQVALLDGQKWRHLETNFATDASSATWWPNL